MDGSSTGLSVVIPSKNPSNLAISIASVRTREPRIPIVAVDDGLPVSWRIQTPSLYVLPGSRPFIFSRNINIGIKACAGDVILMNDDAVLRTAGGFTALQRAARSHPEYGVISAACNNVGNQEQNLRAGGRLRETARMVCFVCVLIPRGTINSVGLLDERFTGSIAGEMVYGGEDDDYCYRVRKAGLKIGIFDGCFVDHSMLPSTFRPRGEPLPINATRKRFREIHGFEMGMR